MPVLDDWEAFAKLVGELARQFAASPQIVDIVAVDDGSRVPLDLAAISLSPLGPIRRIDVVRLALNLGHQRAIAVGLVEVSARDDLDAVIVMDCDGEDRPAELPKILAETQTGTERVIFAQRAKRSETLPFRIGHAVYKNLFWILTGRRIDFGNFALLPIAAVRRLCHTPDLWNKLPAAVMRSRLPYSTVPTVRGRRYAGQSKMSWVTLVIHGLSALSVYTDVIFVRVLIAAALVAVVALLGILAAVLIRVTTDLAIPGWTSTVVGFFLMMLIQMVVAVIVTALLILAGRSSRPFVPIADCGVFVASRERTQIHPDPAPAP